jgi:hypothetical protein
MSSSLTRSTNPDLASPAVHRRPEETWQRNRGGRMRAFPLADSWWTGPNPKAPSCPGRKADGWISVPGRPDLVRCTVSNVMDDFADGWMLSAVLIASLTDEED